MGSRRTMRELYKEMIYKTKFGYTQSTPELLSKQIVFGCILGDGYLNSNGTLTIDHSVNQAPYLFWKYHEKQEC